jgi:hypothetical protein
MLEVVVLAVLRHQVAAMKVPMEVIHKFPVAESQLKPQSVAAAVLMDQSQVLVVLAAAVVVAAWVKELQLPVKEILEVLAQQVILHIGSVVVVVELVLLAAFQVAQLQDPAELD